jgi:voltage-gated potassium channel
MITLMGAIAISLVEPDSGNIHNFFDAIWWSLVTITTVGYGDLYPVSFWGRIVGIVFIFLGFIVFSTFTAYVASNFIDQKIKERKGLNKIKLRNHVVICGWNSSSNRILSFLASSEDFSQVNIVLVNELAEEKIISIRNKFDSLHIKFIKGDFTNQEILNRANIKEAEQVILLYDESKPDATPSDERTIIAAHNISSMKIKSKVNIQLKKEKYLPNIQRDKIQNVVIYDDLGGDIMANATINPYIPNVIQDIVKYKDGVGLRETEIPEDFVGKTYLELFEYYKMEKNMILIGIVTENPDFSIHDILSDDSSNIDKFIKKQFELSGKKLAIKEEHTNIKVKPSDDYIIDIHDIAIVL